LSKSRWRSRSQQLRASGLFLIQTSICTHLCVPCEVTSRGMARCRAYASRCKRGANWQVGDAARRTRTEVACLVSMPVICTRRRNHGLLLALAQPARNAAAGSATAAEFRRAARPGWQRHPRFQ
jgi:hypothetical protein